jgi:hypothetical protein
MYLAICPYFFYGCMILPLETLPPGDPNGGVVYIRIVFVSRGSISTWVILNIRFLRRGVVSTSPHPEAEGPPLVGCPRLLIQFIHSYPPYRRPFLHPQPEDAPCRGDRNPHSWTKCTWRNKKVLGGDDDDERRKYTLSQIQFDQFLRDCTVSTFQKTVG